MRDVTLCLSFYINNSMLAEQYRQLRALPADLKTHLRLIVVDDCSPDPAWAEDLGLPMRLYRMQKDIAWNQDACRNLAVKEAETDWVLMTDMDHIVPEQTWRRVITGSLDPNTAFRFARVSMPKRDAYKPHPNSWLMTTAVFEKAGGYDERFAGYYGTDGDFVGRLSAQAPIEQLKEHIIRYPREVIPDASTTTLIRKSEENGEAIKRIKAERKLETDGRPKRYQTPWERIA